MNLCVENQPEPLLYDDRCIATVMEDIGWCAIGPYTPTSRMGGCDCLRTVQEVKDAIAETLECCNKEGGYFGIVFEGMMISTIKSTFYELLLDYMDDGMADSIIVVLRASLESCLRRIRGRGSMRPNLNVDNVRNKCEMIIRHAETYDQNLVRWMSVDCIPEKDMALEFLKVVGDKALVEVIEGWRKVKSRR